MQTNKAHDLCSLSKAQNERHYTYGQLAGNVRLEVPRSSESPGCRDEVFQNAVGKALLRAFLRERARKWVMVRRQRAQGQA